MSWLRTLLREFELVYLHWALREIDPLHVDVPAIAIRINHLEAARARALASA